MLFRGGVSFHLNITVEKKSVFNFSHVMYFQVKQNILASFTPPNTQTHLTSSEIGVPKPIVFPVFFNLATFCDLTWMETSKESFLESREGLILFQVHYNTL